MNSFLNGGIRPLAQPGKISPNEKSEGRGSYGIPEGVPEKEIKLFIGVSGNVVLNDKNGAGFPNRSITKALVKKPEQGDHRKIKDDEGVRGYIKVS